MKLRFVFSLLAIFVCVATEEYDSRMLYSVASLLSTTGAIYDRCQPHPLELLFSTTGRVLVDRDTNKIIHLQAMAGGDDELVYPYEKFYPQILAQLKELEILKPKLIEALYNRVGKHARCVQAAMAGVARN